MKTSNFVILCVTVLIAGLLSSCAALQAIQSQVLFQSAGVEDRREASNKLGLGLEEDHYKMALERWPGIEGAQLQRRALILSKNPTATMLRKMDLSHSEHTDLEILSQLLRNQASR